MKHEPAVRKRGKPVVKVVPAESKNDGLFGFMAGKFKIVGDIEAPLVPLRSWKIIKK
jgi:antitoxin (DNA-binding transcriptional repressor) of toxin-antitoxin stability system